MASECMVPCARACLVSKAMQEALRGRCQYSIECWVVKSRSSG